MPSFSWLYYGCNCCNSLSTQISKSGASVKVGVNVGDTFTYKLTGDSILFSSDASTPAYLSEYNETNYYQVIITGVNGSVVSFDTIWQFTNGTAIQQLRLDQFGDR